MHHPLALLTIFLSLLTPTLSEEGIVAGILGIYHCGRQNFSKDCQWTEIQPEDRVDGTKCIQLHSDLGFGSMGPDPSLSVAIWDKKDCSGDPLPMLKALQCPGQPMMGLNHVYDRTYDLWVKVKVMKRKDMPKKLPEGCEYEGEDDLLETKSDEKPGADP